MSETSVQSKKLRCLQIITRSDWAGAQKVVYALVKGLSNNYKNEIEIEVACGRENGMLIKELKDIGIKVHVVPNLVREISPLRDLKAYFELKEIIKEGNFDVVHVHSSKAGVLGRIAAKKCGVKKIIYTVHGWWPIEQYVGIKRKFFILAERFAARYCDNIVFLCQKEKEKAKKWGIGTEYQYIIIPNAILPIENATKGLLRNELGISEDIKIVGNVARLDPQKNPFRFLNIAKSIISHMNNVVFVWIGGNVVDDFYSERVEEFLKINKELENKVFFLPFRKDAIELMTDFDVFLLTSDSEGMPLSVLEARSLGIPVVSTDVGCVEEMVGVTAKSDEELVKILSKTLQDQNREFHVNWTYDDFVSAYYKIYKTSEKYVAKDS